MGGETPPLRSGRGFRFRLQEQKNIVLRVSLTRFSLKIHQISRKAHNFTLVDARSQVWLVSLVGR